MVPQRLLPTFRRQQRTSSSIAACTTNAANDDTAKATSHIAGVLPRSAAAASDTSLTRGSPEAHDSMIDHAVAAIRPTANAQATRWRRIRHVRPPAACSNPVATRWEDEGFMAASADRLPGIKADHFFHRLLWLLEPGCIGQILGSASGTPWPAKAYAPTTRNSTFSADNAFNISAKSQFIPRLSAEGPRCDGERPDELDPFGHRHRSIGIGLRLPAPSDPFPMAGGGAGIA